MLLNNDKRYMVCNISHRNNFYSKTEFYDPLTRQLSRDVNAVLVSIE